MSTTTVQNDAQQTETPAVETDADTSALATVEPKVAKLMEQNDTSIAKIVTLAVATLDPKDALVKYARLGGEVLKHARWQKKSFTGTWEKEDYKRLCDKIADQVKFSVPIKDVRMDVYARVHLFVEAVRPFCEGIEKLSYYQVANKFLPMLQFDAVDLTAEIKKGWYTFLQETLAQQIGAEPLSVKALDAKIAEQTAELAREKLSGKTAEQIQEAEDRAKEAAFRKERNAAQGKVSTSLDKAITDGHADAQDVSQIVQKVLKDHGLELPSVGIDPATCSKVDLKMFFAVMLNNERISEIRFAHKLLGKMVESLEAAAEEETAERKAG